MALEKVRKIDKIEMVGDYKIFQCREIIQIKEDGIIISSSYHRTTYYPTSDISDAFQEVKDIAN